MMKLRCVVIFGLLLVVVLPTTGLCDDSSDLGAVVKFKHKVRTTGDVLRVVVLVNDIGSEDPRPVALWLSDDPILEAGDQFLAEDTISDYERVPGMLGMPVLTKLKVASTEEMQGKFAIITIGTAREIFQTGDQSLALIREIGHPECVSDLFLREDEPNDDKGQAVNLGNFKREYCVFVEGTILSDGSEGGNRDIDRYHLRVRDDIAIETILTHDEENDLDLSIAKPNGDEILESCEVVTTPERCVIAVSVIDEPVEVELMVIPGSGVGSYTMTIREINQQSTSDVISFHQTDDLLR